MSTVAMARETKSDSYNEIPYPGGAFRATHPSHLAMVARILGLEPPKPSKCRVLELGCSMGSNLIPMAQSLPDSQFVGIDFADAQVREGTKIIETLGLSNIELRHQSILDFEEEGEPFDFILCHGVYSWVSHEVQDRILDISNKHLSPNGVAYVSYNTYPGWHFRGLIRDMMQYHVADFSSPQDKIAQARGLLDFLVKYSKSHSPAYGAMLKEEADMLGASLDSYLFHEHLEEINEPLYFHDFVQRVDRAGLRYMADSSVATMVAQFFDENAAEILRNAPVLRREQYMDFLRNRMFRGSLLCKQNLTPDYRLPSHTLAKLHVTLKQPLNVDKSKPGEVVWQNPSGRLSTEEPISTVIERINNDYPAWIPISELIEQQNSAAHGQAVRDALLMGFVRGIFVLAEEPVAISKQVSDKPNCTPYARYQAQRGPKITGLLHHDFVVQPQQRYLIEHLDGTRTATELAEMLHDACVNGRFQITREGSKEVVSMEEMKQICHAELERMRYLSILTC